MKIPTESFGLVPNSLEWRCKNRVKSVILKHFLGIFEIFGGGKGTPDHKYGKK
jgi:hypothetical protein